MNSQTDNSRSDDYSNHEFLAKKYYREKKYKLALNECQSFLAVDDKSVTMHILLSKIFFSLENYAMAEQEANIALGLAPSSKEAQNMLGILLIQKGDLLEAKSFLQTAIQENPNYWRYHWNLGLVYTYENAFQSARIAHWNAFSLKPTLLSLSGLILAIYRVYPTPLGILFALAVLFPFINRTPISLLVTPIAISYIWSVGIVHANSINKTRGYIFIAAGFLTLFFHIMITIIGI
ncbi:MAG TPA: hypothetical protein DCX53_06340 [Anaerolineae bacterium]|nr:hypothetical protein [Anaerolineae bacterium]